MFDRKSTTTVDLSTLRSAIETGDEATLVAMYDDDAQLTIVDKDRPPSKPTIVAGKPAIADYYHDVCGRAMTHTVEQVLVAPDGIAFTEACRYSGGMRVLSSNLLELRNGKIVRHSLVQAWDA
jgi:hypothetical protein